jgi:ribosomal protein L21
LDTILNDPRQSRLFAIIAVGGNQFKVTTEDTILIRNHFYPSIGDKIRLEKVIFF